MKNKILLVLLLLITNFAYSQSTSNISDKVFDIKGIKMGISIMQLEKLLANDTENCQIVNLEFSKHTNELKAMADVCYACQAFKLYGRKTGFFEAYFINKKLSGISIGIGDTETDKEEDIHKNSFPDFYNAFIKKFNVQPKNTKIVPLSSGRYTFKTDYIYDKEGSLLFIDGEMLTINNRVSGFKSIRLFFVSDGYLELVSERLRKLDEYEKLNNERIRGKDL